MNNRSNTYQRLFLLSQLINLRLLADLKRSFLGWAWLLILPLLAILTWIFMKSSGVVSPGNTDVPYPAFILLSITLWGAFYDSYKNCSLIFQNYAKILLVNRVPISTIILSELIISVIRFLIPFAFVIIFFLFRGFEMSAVGIALFVALIPLVMLGGAIGLVSGLLNAIARDFSMVADNVMRIMMFLSPIVYAPQVSKGMLKTIVKYNPVTYLVSNCRELLFFGKLYLPEISIWVSIGVIVVFFILTNFFISNISRILERADL